MLAIAIPLIVSTGAWSVQQFVDRMFLAWYSKDAVAAAMPAGMASFAALSLFLGTAGYTGTFVAQNFGARRDEQIGPVVWQGVYVAVVAAIVQLALIPLAGPFFRFVGHGPEVLRDEVSYFQVLCLGAGPAVASNAMAGFFSGRGKTWTVMAVNVAGTAVNLVLDYALIFGNFGFPEMGISGAALATVIGTSFGFLLYCSLLALPANERRYRTLSAWRPDWHLLRRLTRYGLPNGVQFFIDLAGFTAFIMLVGRLGTDKLAATNIAMNVNTLAFMPMIGVGIAVSILVGQYLGAERPNVAERATWSGFHLTMLYMASISAAYVLLPGLFIAPYAARMSPEQVAALRPTLVVLLRFIAFYSLFDSMNIVFSSAIKGAGDTRYVMRMILLMSLGVLVLPSYLALHVFGRGLYTAWAILTAYVILLGFVFLARFLAGHWRSMRVIEPQSPPALPRTMAESPTAEV